MKTAKPILFLMLMLSLTAPGRLFAGFTELFQQAAGAYDEGRFADAARLYEDLLKEGAGSPEVFYNLGNARFKNGEDGLAVLNYRRAQYFSPRDPDIRANLDYAMSRNSAVRMSQSTAAQLAENLSLREWENAMLTFYWLAAAAAILWMLDAARRPVYSKLLMLLAVLLIFCAGGVRYWKNLQRMPEAVMVETGRSAFFAPIESSTAHFSLPVGSLVRIHEIEGRWLKVEADGKEGWIPDQSCRAVYPWISPADQQE